MKKQQQQAHQQEEEDYGAKTSNNVVTVNNDFKKAAAVAAAAGGGATAAIPATVKRASWPTSYCAEEFPWELIQVRPPKKHKTKQGCYFSGLSMLGAPFGYPLRLHMLGVVAPFGFSPPMADSSDQTKWSYPISLEVPSTWAAFRRGDDLMKPILMKLFSGFKCKDYIEMAKEATPNKDGATFASTLKAQVQTKEGVPETAKIVGASGILEPTAWEAWKKRHVADVMIELKSAWCVSGKCGLKFELLRLRPHETLNQEALFPDEVQNESTADNESNECKAEQDGNGNGDSNGDGVSTQTEDVDQNNDQTQVEAQNENQNQNQNQNLTEGQADGHQEKRKQATDSDADGNGDEPKANNKRTKKA